MQHVVVIKCEMGCTMYKKKYAVAFLINIDVKGVNGTQLLLLTKCTGRWVDLFTSLVLYTLLLLTPTLAAREIEPMTRCWLSPL